MVVEYYRCGFDPDRFRMVPAGVNVLLGSFMSGNTLYSVLGTLLMVVGMIILAFTNRRSRGE